VRSGKINCTQVLLKFHEYYAPVHELSLSTTNRCTQTQLIIKKSCTQLKYSSTHCNRGRSCRERERHNIFQCTNTQNKKGLARAHASERRDAKNKRLSCSAPVPLTTSLTKDFQPGMSILSQLCSGHKLLTITIVRKMH
jgi:hypothetical protein